MFISIIIIINMKLIIILNIKTVIINYIIVCNEFFQIKKTESDI